MSKSKAKSADRLLAIILSMLLTSSLVPLPIAAETQDTASETVNTEAVNLQNQAGAVVQADEKKTCQVTMNITGVESNEKGLRFWLNGYEQSSSYTMNYGENLEIVATAQGEYRIASVIINGEAIQSTISKQFGRKLENVTEDVTIEVVVTKTYTIDFQYDAALGSLQYQTDNAEEIALEAPGEVKFKIDENAKIVKFDVYPKDAAKYRVASLTVDGNTKEYTSNGNIIVDYQLPANANHTVSVVFALNNYTVKAQSTQNGTVTIQNESVEYGGSSTVTVTPDSGYYISSLSVVTAKGETPVDPTSLDGNGSFTISNITEDYTIKAGFAQVVSASLDNISWNYADAISSDGNTYYFVAGKTVTFKTDKEGIILYDRNGQQIGGGSNVQSVDITSEQDVARIDVYYKDSIFAWWGATPHAIDLTQDPICIRYYAGAEVTLTPEQLPDGYTCYSDDVKVAVTVNIPEGYPAVSSMEYWITGKEDELVTLTEIPESITVSAADNNAENVQLNVRITDAAGLTATADTIINISTDLPTVDKIEVSGTPAAGALAGYFQQGRTATVVISDKDYTCNKSVDQFSIVHNGEELSAEEKQNMISWSSSAGQHTATIVFSEDGTYTWGMDYVNLAGKFPESIPQSASASPYSFVIDSTEPQACTITASEKTWDKILSALTFGLWKQSPIEVVASTSDDPADIQEIAYYKHLYSSNLEAISADGMTYEALETLYADGFFTASDSGVTVDVNEKAVVYARILDNAGHVVYLGTDGLIVDNVSPQQISMTIADPSTGNSLSANSIHNRALQFNVEVNDLAAGNAAFSGIKRVYYTVEKDGKQIGDENELYTWSASEGALRDSWSGNFPIDPKSNPEYNVNDLNISIHIEDNAGNIYPEIADENSSVNISMNTTAPVVEIAFDDNYSNKRLDDAYFWGRTATITITDRADSFDAAAATAAVSIAATGDVTDAEGNVVENAALYTISDWTTSADGYTHTATVTFNANYNANYEWADYQYTNLAGTASNTIAVDDFTIDRKAPTGEISIEANIWDELLETLTFGYYTNTNYEVLASAADTTSPLQLAYYIDTNRTGAHYTSDALDSLETQEGKQWTIVEQPYEMPELLETLEDDQHFVVYLRVMDYAGNYIYVSSDGHIIDSQAPVVTLTPDEPVAVADNGVGIYNRDVNVTVDVTDAEPYSGIKSVEYWVLKDGVEITQEYVLYSFDETAPAHKDLVSKWQYDLPILSKLNNSCDVEVFVRVEDMAGNVTEESVPLDIDITAPTIEVSYDNNEDNNGNGYFDAVRTATVTVTERTHHFNAENAEIEITAVDGAGNAVENAYTMVNWTTVDAENPDEQQHILQIQYESDANYTFDVAFTDIAQNKNDGVNTGASVAPFAFTVDTTAPTGTVKAESAEGRTVEWDSLLASLNFGFWSRTSISVTGTASDVTSPIADISYYQSSSVNALTAAELDKITTWQSLDKLTVGPNAQFAVYLKITDMAGNITYISTDGLIVDNMAPQEELTAPEISLTPQQSASGIYSGDVKIAVTVEDPLVGGTYSGLRTVSYRVLNMGQETQSGTLYTFGDALPKQGDLKQVFTGEITVDSTLNNSNDVVIEVFAEDNSLNTSTNSTSIRIDTTAPVIQVSYNNNEANGTFFNAPRTATITVIERNFDANEVHALITNTEQTIPALSAWSQSGGTGNGDDTRWTATIVYGDDGDYTFAVSCADLAGNTCSESAVQFASNTVAPTEFTIDLSNPVISVTYDNMDAKNGNYYNDNRTATITVEEHNFNEGNVQVSLSAVKDGTAAEAPVVSGWTTAGDTHTATVVFDTDARYTIDVTCSDEAGNAAADFDAQTFYIDKTAPTLSIDNVDVVNSGDVAPVVSYSDANFDAESVSISLSAVNRGGVELKGEYAEETSGGSFTFSNFEKKQEVDDIYTLTASTTDLAGNTTEEEMIFSVNRFGSTYALYESAKQINGTFVQTPIDIMIDEINVDSLSEIKITLFKNNETIVLEEGTDYSVDLTGGNGEWHKYTYTIFQENFMDDGVYRITLHSKDAADNIAENTLDTKNLEIGFGVDKTPPAIVVANLENRKTYAEELKNVVLTADDNLKLASVSVFLDGDEYKTWTGEEVEQILSGNDAFDFDIAGDSTKAHNVKIVCVDEAGNPTEVEITDFYVTTNLLVRFFNNKLLFFGSIAGVVALTGLLILFIILKRRKKEQQ